MTGFVPFFLDVFTDTGISPRARRVVGRWSSVVPVRGSGTFVKEGSFTVLFFIAVGGGEETAGGDITSGGGAFVLLGAATLFAAATGESVEGGGALLEALLLLLFAAKDNFGGGSEGATGLHFTLELLAFPAELLMRCDPAASL